MHYYKILRHNAGFDEGTSYWEKILARYLAATGGGKIHTTLPITFTSTSWKLAGWTIYGNNEIGVNKYGFTDTTKVDGNTTFTADGASGTITASGLPASSSSFISIASIDTFAAGTYTLTGDAGASTTTHYIYVRKTNTSTTIANDYAENMQTFTLAEPTKLTIFYRLVSTNAETTHIFKPMICKQGETPTTFEPYTVGVGKKTKNLLDISSSTVISHVDVQSVDGATGSITITADVGYTYRGSSKIITDLLEIGRSYIITIYKTVKQRI